MPSEPRYVPRRIAQVMVSSTFTDLQQHRAALIKAIRGEGHLGRGEWAQAAESLHEAVSMAHAVEQRAPEAAARLALARLHLGQLSDPRREAMQLATEMNGDLSLARLWQAIGDLGEAKNQATEAYRNACADGEPYVYRFDLTRSRALLEELGVEIPEVPRYDSSKDRKFPMEDEVTAYIAALRAAKAAEERGGA